MFRGYPRAHTPFLLCLLALLALFPASAQSPNQGPGADDGGELPLDQIRLPKGFEISVFARNVPNAREMAVGAKGTLFVGSRRAGKVHAVVDRDGDYVADEVHLLAEDLLMPTGLAFHDGDLYVAEIHQIWRYDDIESHLEYPGEPKLVSDAFPEIRHHGWKFIAVGPDGWLYVPVGAPCNICESSDEIFASIGRLKLDGSGYEVIAHGVRNTVGFDWHPETSELWFTDNGRDYLGENVPPDELNVLKEKGQHFGYPYCHGTDISDPIFGKERPCREFVQPQIELGPHVGAIGMTFYTGEMFPPEYKNSILIAEHGSWNREEPLGYRVMRVTLKDGKAATYRSLASGWLPKDGDDRRPWGRPTDIQVLGDGSILISEDLKGVIYRVTYSK